jgi:hypothetical protein
MRSSNQNGSSTSGEYEPKPGPRPKRIIIVPHWNAILVLVAIGVLYALLPAKVSIGPSWLLLAVEGVFILPFVNQAQGFACHAQGWFLDTTGDCDLDISGGDRTFDLDPQRECQWD